MRKQRKSEERGVVRRRVDPLIGIDDALQFTDATSHFSKAGLGRSSLWPRRPPETLSDRVDSCVQLAPVI